MPNLLDPSYNWTAYQQAEIDGATFTLRGYGAYAAESSGSFKLLGSPDLPSGSTLSGVASWSTTVANEFASFYLWLTVTSENVVIYQQMIYAPGDPNPNVSGAPFFVEIPDGNDWVTIDIQAGNSKGPVGGAPPEYEQLASVSIVGSAPEPSGCFWDGLVMAVEDCGGDVDPPGGDWEPMFGHRVPTSNHGMQIHREDFCDSDLYNAIATGGESLLVTHIGIRGSNAPSPGVDPGDGWNCGDGPTAEPAWIPLGEPMYMSAFQDSFDNRAWTLPFIGSIPGALGDYYGFVDVRITVENVEGVTQIEGVAFASPGF